MAAVAVAYIVGQTVVDTWGSSGATIGKEKRGGSEGRPAFRALYGECRYWHLAAAEGISLGLSLCIRQVPEASL